MPSKFELSDTTPAAPGGTTNVLWQSDGSGNVSGNVATPYDVVAGWSGKPTDAGITLLLTFTRAVTFAGNFAGSYGSVGTNPTSTAAFAVTKNGSSCGSVSISTSGVFTFTTTSGAAQSFAAGDRLKMTAPSPQDTTLADVSITFAGTR